MAKADSDFTPSSADWRAVEKTLPAGADRDAWFAELDRIRRDQLSPEKYVEIFEERARQSERLIRKSPLTADKVFEYEQDARWCREQAKHYARLIGQPPKFRRYCEILLLWMLRGGGDPLITPRTDAPEIRYLRAAAKVVFGETISAPTAKDNIRRFRHMNFSAAPLRGEGILSADAFVIRPLAGRLGVIFLK